MPLSDRAIYRSLASKGNYGDTMLAHISPTEAEILRDLGGSGTINKKTGLPQFFNYEDYYEANPDVYKAMMAEGKGYDPNYAGAHFENYGRSEGRLWEKAQTPAPEQTGGGNPAPAPPIESPEERYLRENPDVAANEYYRSRPLEHYNTFGKGERRTWESGPTGGLGGVTPTGVGPPEGVKEKTDEERYEEYLNPFRVEPWQQKQGEQPTGYENGQFGAYWLRGTDYGPYKAPPKSFYDWMLDEGSVVPEESQPIVPYSTGEGDHTKKTDKNFKPPENWDAAKYLKMNPDLQSDPWAVANPLAHFALFGGKEGRGKIPGGYEKANFDQAQSLYLENNPDVLEAATSYMNAREKYLKDNPDVAADTGFKGNPWEHYNTVGKTEGRKWEGSSPIDPFEHYETLGKNEGRKWIGAEAPTLKQALNKKEFTEPMGWDLTFQLQEAKKAINKGYVEITDEIAGNTKDEYGNRQYQPGDLVNTKFGTHKIGERIPVDKYGWMKTQEGEQAVIPPGSYFNILTKNYVPPGTKITAKTKGSDLPSRPGTSNFQNFMAGFMKQNPMAGASPGWTTGEKSEESAGVKLLSEIWKMSQYAAAG